MEPEPPVAPADFLPSSNNSSNKLASPPTPNSPRRRHPVLSSLPLPSPSANSPCPSASRLPPLLSYRSPRPRTFCRPSPPSSTPRLSSGLVDDRARFLAPRVGLRRCPGRGGGPGDRGREGEGADGDAGANVPGQAATKTRRVTARTTWTTRRSDAYLIRTRRCLMM